MILAVCLNPALDITYQVSDVDWDGVNRPDAVLERPGGKGVNVGRNLLSFGLEVEVLGFAGGAAGSAVRAGLRRLALPAALTEVAGETRRTVTVADGHGRAALFNEPGPEISPAEFTRFRAGYRAALRGADAVVLSGSLPRGLDPGCYAGLIELAADAGVPAVLDTSGPALRLALPAGPAIVKPNLAELEELAGVSLTSAAGPDLPAVAAAAAALRADGAGAVAVSLGPSGLLAVTPGECWRAWPAAVVSGNATGAGDAVTAALVHGLVQGRSWEQQARHAVALGAAAAAAPAAGEFSDTDYLAALRTVRLRREKVPT